DEENAAALREEIVEGGGVERRHHRREARAVHLETADEVDGVARIAAIREQCEVPQLALARLGPDGAKVVDDRVGSILHQAVRQPGADVADCVAAGAREVRHAVVGRAEDDAVIQRPCVPADRREVRVAAYHLRKNRFASASMHVRNVLRTGRILLLELSFFICLTRTRSIRAPALSSLINIYVFISYLLPA